MDITWGPSPVSIFSSFSRSFLKEGIAGHREGEEEEGERSRIHLQDKDIPGTGLRASRGAVLCMIGKVALTAIWKNQCINNRLCSATLNCSHREVLAFTRINLIKCSHSKEAGEGL